MAFQIKRGDLLPNLPFQLFQPDKVTPLDLSTAQSVSIVIVHKASKAALLKNACTLTDAVNGKGIYDWQLGDTDLADNYQYEFEIIWANGDPQTVPVDTYFDLIVVEDLG